MTETRDLVVIGGGSGGFAAAVRAAQLGGNVAIIEQAHVGGNCMHNACIPLTYLMRASELMDALRRASSMGIQARNLMVDMDALHERKQLIVDMLRMGTEELLDDYGVTMIEGRGELVDRTCVSVGDRRIRAQNVIIATGSVAGQLAVEGGDLPDVIDTDAAVNLRRMPGRIAVIGHQPWEIELAQYFNAMGSEVVLISGSDRLLPQADREISQRLAKHLHDSGVDVRRRAEVTAIRQRKDGGLDIILSGGQGKVVVGRALASPRFPNSTGLGLRVVGVATERGAVVVDEHMETNVAGIYAVGDVTPGPMWSHKANAEGIAAAEHALGMAGVPSYPIDYQTIPHCLHTHPEIAWVGMTADEAADRGMRVRIGKAPVAINPEAMILGASSGVIKIVADDSYGKVLGVHMMGPRAIDLINVASTAMLCEATVYELMHMVPAHPSVGEALVDAAMDVERRSLHLPKW